MAEHRVRPEATAATVDGLPVHPAPAMDRMVGAVARPIRPVVAEEAVVRRMRVLAAAVVVVVHPTLVVVAVVERITRAVSEFT